MQAIITMAGAYSRYISMENGGILARIDINQPELPIKANKQRNNIEKA
jgi:hypothetical protein